jgi:hypothetical protein
MQIIRVYDECTIRHKNSFLPDKIGKERDIHAQFSENRLTDTVVQAVVEGVYHQG